MPIIRKEESNVQKPQFTVGVNIILTGSKKLNAEQQEALMTVNKVRVLIVDADDPENILVDEEALAREFSTGSVGYGLNIRSATFRK
ncbi:MAG: hypothetical protein JXA33_15795 [Anaerolineae bacterium]|nr:hypothetical protein [Anaerolineae bacterium]